VAHDANAEIAAAAGLDLQLSLQPYSINNSSNSSNNEDDVDMTCVDDLLNQLTAAGNDDGIVLAAEKLDEVSTTTQADRQMLDDLWLEANLSSVDTWTTDLFPDLA